MCNLGVILIVDSEVRTIHEVTVKLQALAFSTYRRRLRQAPTTARCSHEAASDVTGPQSIVNFTNIRIVQVCIVDCSLYIVVLSVVLY